MQYPPALLAPHKLSSNNSFLLPILLIFVLYVVQNPIEHSKECRLRVLPRHSKNQIGGSPACLNAQYGQQEITRRRSNKFIVGVVTASASLSQINIDGVLVGQNTYQL